MSSGIALSPSTKIEPGQIVIQEYGAFEIIPNSAEQITVTAKQGVEVDSVLYPFAGQMVKHQGRWRFWVDSLSVPKLTPKKKQEAIERVTHEVNTYLDQHPELFERVAIRVWEQRLNSLRYLYRQKQAAIVRTQAHIEQQQEALRTQQEGLAEQQRELEEHLAQRPDGAIVPEDEATA